jgi:hypothetical protein
MFRIEPGLRLRMPTQSRLKSSGRIFVVCLGLGLGTAFAADLASSTVPESATVDPDLPVARWRVFDPGYLVDHLPFKVTIGQTISYSDNVRNLPSNVSTISNLSRGDFYSDTTVAIASRFPMGAQTFFFNGSYNPRRYFRDTQLDADNFSINGGVDYHFLDRCTGRLIGGYAQYQTPFDETAGFGINNVMSTSFNETARCGITGHVVGLFNSGVSRLEYTSPPGLLGSTQNLALNNYTQHYVSGGLEYDVSGLSTIRGQATFTTRDFTNRPASLNSGLASQTQQNDFQIYYTRILTAKIDFSASGGFSVFSTPNQPNSKTFVTPTYSAQLNVHPTPKITASFMASRSVGAPQSIVADIQETDAQSVSLSYIYSPKLTISTVLARATSTNPTLSNTNAVFSATGVPLVFANSNNTTASVIASYQATPLINATAAYTYSERTSTSGSNIRAVSNVFRVGLVYTR